MGRAIIPHSQIGASVIKKLALILMTVILPGSDVIAGEQAPKTIKVEVGESISGASLALIQTAIPEFIAAGLTLDVYVVTVIKTGGVPSVLFRDPNKPRGVYGNPPGYKPSFEVQLSEDGSRVIEAYFPR
jgi:hypothetical protein